MVHRRRFSHLERFDRTINHHLLVIVGRIAAEALIDNLNGVGALICLILL